MERITLPIEFVNKNFPDGYKIIDSIPEDPCFYTDHDCFTFEKTADDMGFFLRSGNYILMETFENFDSSLMPLNSSEPTSFGKRHLIIVERAALEHLYANGTWLCEGCGKRLITKYHIAIGKVCDECFAGCKDAEKYFHPEQSQELLAKGFADAFGLEYKQVEARTA